MLNMLLKKKKNIYVKKTEKCKSQLFISIVVIFTVGIITNEINLLLDK